MTPEQIKAEFVESQMGAGYIMLGVGIALSVWTAAVIVYHRAIPLAQLMPLSRLRRALFGTVSLIVLGTSAAMPFTISRSFRTIVISESIWGASCVILTMLCSGYWVSAALPLLKLDQIRVLKISQSRKHRIVSDLIVLSFFGFLVASGIVILRRIPPEMWDQ
jgi:hypothetical protein